MSLTAREKEIVALVVRGLADKEIAVKLGTSVHTVRNQMSKILRKTGSANRTHLAVVTVRRQIRDVIAC